jgi:hypothetical protein
VGGAAVEGIAVMRLLLSLFLFAAVLARGDSAGTNTGKATVIVLVGAAGEESFGKVFTDAAANWEKAAQSANAKFIQIGASSSKATNDFQEFRAALERESKDTTDELWIAMIGHGTFDGRETKFNLRGPDLSANEFSNLLATVRRPVAIINGASSSAPFIKALSGSNRIVVTATRSGAEENFTRFGKYVSQAIADPEADLDKDGQTSLLEAFLMASRRVAEFYKNEGRLATEHALIDDNGDGFGTPSEWFRGIRAVKKAANDLPLDGMRAHQWHLIHSTEDQKLSPEERKRRDQLEVEINQLRQEKTQMSEDDYYRKLEALLTKLGEIELSTDGSSAK